MSKFESIAVGTKVEGVYGAMIPVANGFIASIIDDVVLIKWEEYDDDGVLVGSFAEQKRVSEIRQPGTRSANGSPIGVFFSE